MFKGYGINVVVSTRTPVKGATYVPLKSIYTAVVSTRAPVKGATRVKFYVKKVLMCFNSRSREGSDHLN